MQMTQHEYDSLQHQLDSVHIVWAEQTIDHLKQWNEQLCTGQEQLIGIVRKQMITDTCCFGFYFAAVVALLLYVLKNRH